MLFGTITDRLLFYLKYGLLRLAQFAAFMLYWAGWGCEKSAPLLLSWSARLKSFVLSKLNQDTCKGPEVSQTRIDEPEQSEAQPDCEGHPSKVQVNSLSTRTGPQSAEKPSEVSLPMPEEVVETEVEDKFDIETGLPFSDENGSMPSSANAESP